MIRYGSILALGLLAGGSGCANLQRSLAVRAPQHHEHAAIAEADAEAGPIDPFHPPVESTATRMSRFFPGLARHERAASPAVESLRRGSTAPSARDRDLEAVPRPEADDETATAALSRRGRRPIRRSDVLQPEPETATRGEIADREGPAMPRPGEAPVLAAAVLAEIDPADAPKPRDLPEPIEPPQEEARMASAASPPRGTAPLPPLDPTARRPLPPRLPLVDRRGESRPEDDQARQARGREDEGVASEVVKPLLDVAEERPTGDAPGAPSPAGPEEEPTTGRPSESDRPDAPADPPADPPSIREPEPDAEPIADGPPPIEPPPAPPEASKIVEPEDPDAGGDPVLAGRPRMPGPSARRDALPPGVPPASFPRSYYGVDPLPQDSPKPEAREEAGRWTWRPRLFKRLRGG